eukprot:CAMPEP_0178572934 /NCGR_PEP_ID=MMETSP0697-20121206/18502_1 /TAXON_ID=265572 /ORGANISM="Extubocellulus spinifer, Strain CCMP396" /LENGTH=1173 /DNA_ID=CAMNT_0020207725 /DNA_START=93 /DNA_END=3616 /DNA_ORIENTATION=-
MTSLCFDRPVGAAAADLAELEYISCLHQTSPDLRTDGTISAVDISLFLKSRYGIEISEADVREVILRNGLSCGGGSYHSGNITLSGKKGSESTDDDVTPGDDKSSIGVNDGDHQASSHDQRVLSSSLVKRSNDTAPTASLDPGGATAGSDYLDLTELVAALLIPELIRSANADTSGDNYLNPLGKERSSSEFDSEYEFQAYLERREQLEAEVGLAKDDVVNEENVRAILRSLGDHVLADNTALVRQMVEAAQPNSDELDVEEGRGADAPAILDSKAFARALLSDVAPFYRLDDDISPHTSFRDVFGHDKTDPGCLGIALCCRKNKDDALRLAGDAEEDPKDLELQAETEEASTPETPMGNEAGVTEPKPSFVGADDLPRDEPDNDIADKAKPTFNAPAIDYSSDTYANRTIGVGLWIFLLLHVLTSGTLGVQDFPSFVPSDLESCPDEPHLGCDVLESFLGWVDTIFTLVVIGGIVIMGVGAMGNRVGETSRLMVLIAMLPCIYFFIKPFFSFGTSPSDLNGQPHRQFALGTSMFCALVLKASRLRQLIYMSVPKGVFHKSKALTRCMSWGFAGGSEVERKQASSHKMNRLMTNASSIAHDTDSIDSSSRSTQVSRSLTHFYEKREEKEKTGGYLWTYRSMRSRDLYRKEGVLFSGRMLAANIMQYAIIVYIILYVLDTVNTAMANYQDSWFIVIVRTGEQVADAFLRRLATVPERLATIAQKAIDLIYSTVLPAIESFQLESCETLFSKANYSDIFVQRSADPSDFDLDADAVANLCSNQNSLQALQTFCTKSTGFYSDMIEEANSFKLLLELSASEKIDGLNDFLQSIIASGFSTMEDTVKIIDPLEPWMVQMAFGLGGLIAFLMSIFLATLYIPSVTSSVLRFRSGAIPSLRDPLFSERYRNSTYLVTYLTGALFWGALIYCAGIAFVIAFIVLALCWIIKVAPQLAGDDAPAPGIWGMIIGFIVTFATQLIIFASCAKAVKLIAFYRKRPAAANIYNLLWEVSWVGTSVMFVAVRTLKLIVAAALQVGRVDVPFLAEGAGQIGPLHLDRMPMIFRTDILQHEAHRHPYIERLGKMYLMKIRHGNAFANAAGSTWRVVFVLAFMPWLRQYRYMARYGDDWKAEIKLANMPGLKNSEHDGDDGKAGKVIIRKTLQTAKNVAAEVVDELVEG